MSSLIPELRPDKNGKLVTRHVRNGSDLGLASSLPVPSLALESPAETKERVISECMDMLHEIRAATNLPDMPYDLGRFFLQALRDQDGLADDMHALLPMLDERGHKSIFNGLTATPSYTQGPGRLALVVKAYPYCRFVDDAIPPGDLSDQNMEKDNLWDVSYEVLSRGGTMRLQVDEENVGDLESTYLLKKLELDESSFASNGDYYRALWKLKAQQEELKPYLPLLLAFGAIRNEGQDPRNWYFNDGWYLWENIKDVKKYPVDKIDAIAAEVIRRGEFSEGIADQIVASSTSTMNDGIL